MAAARSRWIGATLVAVLVGCLLAVALPADAAKSKKKAPVYVPSHGALFNNPLGPRAGRIRIFAHLMGAINHAPRGSIIRIQSWNVNSAQATNALLAAHNRGVSVRVIMDAANLKQNTAFAKLRKGLRVGNASRPYAMRSGATTCSYSCRGSGGNAHAKYFIFSKVGKTPYVVMEGSANLTYASTFQQWNDMFTVVEDKSIYDTALSVFNQAWADKPVATPWVQVSNASHSIGFGWTPWGTNHPGDPVLSYLNQVKCTGAVGAGTRGHTVIRIGQDAIRNSRGLAFAQRLVQLKRQGCDVAMFYSTMGQNVYQALHGKGGRWLIPVTHLVQDTNHDGLFDRYSHMKVTAISGVIGNNRSARLVINGSPNISGVALNSDENYGYLTNANLVNRYVNWISYWVTHPPAYARIPASARLAHPNPYALMEND